MPRFTAETAVFAAKLSHAPESARFLPKPEPVLAVIPAEITAKPAEPDPFIFKSLVRVRKQMNKVNDLMADQMDAEKPDCAAIDRLASALSRLAELERVYDGRPLPGSFRPQSDKASKTRNRPVEVWADETPPQVVSSVPEVKITPASSPQPVEPEPNG